MRSNRRFRHRFTAPVAELLAAGPLEPACSRKCSRRRLHTYAASSSSEMLSSALKSEQFIGSVKSATRKMLEQVN